MIEINSKNIDKELSKKIASTIIDCINSIPMEQSLSYLNGVTVSLIKLTQAIAENGEVQEEDALEKLILSWLSVTDPLTGLKFSKYISTDCIEINLDEL